MNVEMEHKPTIKERYAEWSKRQGNSRHTACILLTFAFVAAFNLYVFYLTSLATKPSHKECYISIAVGLIGFFMIPLLVYGRKIKN
jgi:hypothetical protein